MSVGSPVSLATRRDEVLTELRRILVEDLQVPRDPHTIDASTPLFVTGLGLDSLDAVELLFLVQSSFGPAVAHEGQHPDRAALRTLDTLADAVLRHETGESPQAAGGEIASADDSVQVEVDVVRSGIAVSEVGWSVLRVPESMVAALDAVLPSDLRLRAGQGRHSLLLDAAGVPWADVFAVRGKEGFTLLCDTPEPERLRDRLFDLSQGALDVAPDPSLRALSIDGPYAFRAAIARFDPGILGLPFGSAYWPEPDSLLARFGVTGEFAYLWVLPGDRLDAARQELVALGAQPVHASAIDRCRLENGLWNPRKEGRFGLDAIEAQLQWRLHPGKPHPGSDALAAARAAGPRRRLVGLRVAGCAGEGDAVFSREGEGAARGRIGTILNAAPSGAGTIALAVLDVPFAASGIVGLAVGGHPARTVSTPFVHSRSLFVDPRRDE